MNVNTKNYKYMFIEGTRVLVQNHLGKALFLLCRTYDADADSPCHSMDLSTGLSQIQTSAGALGYFDGGCGET